MEGGSTVTKREVNRWTMLRTGLLLGPDAQHSRVTQDTRSAFSAPRTAVNVLAITCYLFVIVNVGINIEEAYSQETKTSQHHHQTIKLATWQKIKSSEWKLTRP
jgi:hypothetical protein